MKNFNPQHWIKSVFIALIAICLLNTTVKAQAPEMMSYQAIVRDADNNILKNTQVNMQVAIMQGSISGLAVYVEYHLPTTNSNGLISLEIGSGTQASSDFSAIDWSSGPYYIKTEFDLTGGYDFTISGFSQLLSVPYALYAKNAGSGTGGGASAINDLTDAKTGGNSVFLGSGSGANDDGTDNQNVALGVDALNTNTTGNKNTASGYKTLFSNTLGSFHTAIGHQALFSNTYGYHNTAIGNQALFTNIAGDMNTAIGSQALHKNTSGLRNVASGYNALYSNTVGQSNTASGATALYSNTEGFYNTAHGFEALYANTIGTVNTAFGASALYNNTTGSYNTANGVGALKSNTTGESNIAIGYSSQYQNSTGSNNIIMGREANHFNQQGSSNTILGHMAGRGVALHTKSGSVFLGYKAGYNEITDNKLYIDNSDTLKPLIYGDFDADSLKIHGDLKVSGTLKIEGGIPGAGKVLTSDDNGLASWETAASGVTTINDLTDARVIGESIYLGLYAGNNDDGTLNRNVAIGYYALRQNSEGYYNTAIGIYSLSANTTGISNSAYGAFSLWKNTSGGSNTANGQGALYSNTTGRNNTAIGTSSLYSNTTGEFNTATGASSLGINTTGYENIAIGNTALYENTSGHENIAIGNAANFYNQEGSKNTIIGDEAGKGTDNHNKSGNIFLGYRAGYNEITDNNLYIENSASATPLIYGDFDADSVKIHGELKVSSTVRIEGGNPGIGKVLTSDADGLASWETITTGGGASAINDLTDAKVIGGSIFIGQGSGVNDDGSTNQNVTLGIDALKTNTSGNQNIAIGYQSLTLNTIGQQNTAIGYSTLSRNTNGIYNTAIGSFTLYSNTEGTFNTVIGHNALKANTLGDYNTALGNYADYYNQEGSSNTIIGYQAGMGTSLHSKSGNVFLGYQSGLNEVGSNKLYIENSNSATPLIYGDFDADSLKINGELKVASTIKIEGGNPGAGKVLTSDANGLASWETVSIEYEINDLADAKTIGNSVFLGAGTGNNQVGLDYKNVAIGVEALNANTSGSLNNANGYQALTSNTIGSNNTANGYMSLKSNTTGHSNTAGGSLSLAANENGNYNTSTGVQSLLSNISGNSNTANGYTSLRSNTTGSQNTAIGAYALENNTTGIKNISIGTSSGAGIITGSENTIIGVGAGSNYDNSGSVFIGFNAGRDSQRDNELYIDNSPTETPLIWGNFSTNFVKINGRLVIINQHNNSEFHFPDTNGEVGQVLRNNGGGYSYWSDERNYSSNKNLAFDSNKVTINDVLILPPRASAPSNPTQGELYVGTDDHIYCYLGGSWKQLD